MKKILVVEDEENISELICDTLTLGGYEFEPCYDGETAVKKALEEKFSLILLDIMLPKLSGYEVMEKVKHKRIPIIFLSAKHDVSSIVKGLKDGGQDYITKPFEPLELLARIELRTGEDKFEDYKYKDIEVQVNERIVYKNGEQIALAPKEYELLILLLKNVGKALSRNRILNEIWNIDEDIETRTVDYHIQQLRKKLDLKNEIKAVNKIGYRMEKK